MAVVKLWNGSAWQDIVMSTYDGSGWQDKLNLWSGAVWIPTYGEGDLTVDVAATKTIANDSTGAVEANVKIDSDGSLYASDHNGNYGSSYEVWLDNGGNDEVWVQRVIVSGTLTYDAGSARLACTVDRVFGIRNQILDSTKQTVIDLNFYDAASGGNLLDTQRVTLRATETTIGMGCPTCCFTPDTLISIE